MKKFFLFTLICSFFILFQPTTSNGQNAQNPIQKGTTPQRSAEGLTIWLTNLLKLDKKISKDVYQVFFNYELQVEALHKKSTAFSEKKNQYLTISENLNTQLRSVLSIDQYNKYIQSLEEIRANAKAKIK